MSNGRRDPAFTLELFGGPGVLSSGAGRYEA